MSDAGYTPYEPVGSLLKRTEQAIRVDTEACLRKSWLTDDQKTRIWELEQDAVTFARSSVRRVPACKHLDASLRFLEDIVRLQCAGILIHDADPHQR